MAQKIKISVVDFPPLVIRKAGHLEGFEIDLWEAIAKKLGIGFEYQFVKFQELLSTLASNGAEVGFGAITISEEREKIVDFSHPTLSSGLFILINRANRKSIIKTAISIIGGGYKILLYPILFLLFFILVDANLLWFAERGARTFSEDYFPGIVQSIWLVFQSSATVIYGDYTPHTWIGKLIMASVILVGFAMFSIVITELSSLLVMQKMKENVEDEKSLVNKSVATVSGSTSVNTLEKMGARVSLVASLEEGYRKLKNREVAAVVFDAPVLEYFAQHEGKKDFEVIVKLFERQNYGFVFPPNGVMRENVNRAFLALRESGEYRNIYKKYFGDNSSMEL